jgi:ribonucleoside-diphosphate reductase alpha chain
MGEKFSVFAESVYKQKYAHEGEEWGDTAHRVAYEVLNSVGVKSDLIMEVEKLIHDRKFIPGGRYLYATGREYHQTQNCALFRAEDSREGWAELMEKITVTLMSGAGIGVVYSDLREQGAPIRRTGGESTGPLALMQMVNEAGRHIRQGASRRSAIWAGLHWNHPDIHTFIRVKDWPSEVRKLKEQDFNFPACMDGTNVSVILDDAFFQAYEDKHHTQHTLAHSVYWTTVKQMLQTSEPGFSIDVGDNTGENLRNACTEICSYDDSDICNLGSINLARIESIEEMQDVVRLATAFLLAGTVYSLVPFEHVAWVRNNNRRLGLGVMGLHELLLKRGKKYGPDNELEEYLQIFRTINDKASTEFADTWNLSRPVKGRAIAPTGTIGIIAETTTGIEPIFCCAYKRRYLKGSTWHYQYVVDPIVSHLIKEGMDPDDIEDAYTICTRKRLEFQAFVQEYVDHGISSTINIPAWGTEQNNNLTVERYGDLFLEYLPKLRGLTVYADGSRGGQPLTPVPYEEALEHVGAEFVEETSDICSISGRGVCGE